MDARVGATRGMGEGDVWVTGRSPLWGPWRNGILNNPEKHLTTFLPALERSQNKRK